MADFMTACLKTLDWEGTYSNNPNDPGSETNWGITKRDHPDVDIGSLTKTQAIAIYRQSYWNPLYDQISDQSVADKLFDLGVNQGMGTAVKLLQHALAFLEEGPIVAEGVFGSITIAATNSADPAKLLAELKAQAAANYMRIVGARPASVQFALGWARRLMA